MKRLGLLPGAWGAPIGKWQRDINNFCCSLSGDLLPAGHSALNWVCIIFWLSGQSDQLLSAFELEGSKIKQLNCRNLSPTPGSIFFHPTALVKKRTSWGDCEHLLYPLMRMLKKKISNFLHRPLRNLLPTRHPILTRLCVTFKRCTGDK